jgi:hypothetical protein
MAADQGFGSGGVFADKTWWISGKAFNFEGKGC